MLAQRSIFSPLQLHSCSIQHPLPHNIRLPLTDSHPTIHSFASFHIIHPKYQYHHQLTHPHIHTLISRQSVTKCHCEVTLSLAQRYETIDSASARVLKSGETGPIAFFAHPSYPAMLHHHAQIGLSQLAARRVCWHNARITSAR
jgi:hypothetical protein